MYSRNQLYYLHQLGITPWIKKKQSAAFKLLVIIGKPLDKKSQSLIADILFYLELKKEDVQIHIGVPSPERVLLAKAILDFGCSVAGVSVVSLGDLSVYLNTSADKRILMNALAALKNAGL